MIDFGCDIIIAPNTAHWNICIDSYITTCLMAANDIVKNGRHIIPIA